MSTETFKVGEQVEVVSGAFAGTRGAVADLSEFDSVMRIETQGGNAFALIDTVKRLTKPVTAKTSTKPLQQKRR